MTYGTTTYQELSVFIFIFLRPPPWALQAGSEALPACSEALPAGSEALPAGS